MDLEPPRPWRLVQPNQIRTDPFISPPAVIEQRKYKQVLAQVDFYMRQHNA